MHQSFHHTYHTAALLVLLALTGTSGCASKDRWNKVVVSGNVTYLGEPVEIGRIRFIPTDGTRGPITVERIESGRYSTQSTEGVPSGKLRVEISSYDTEEYENAPTGPGAPPIRQLLPAKYNRESELLIAIEPEPSSQTHDFHLD